MLLLLERRDLGRVVLLVDAALFAVAVDVGQLVDGHGVFLIERGAVELLDSRDSLGRRTVFDEGVAMLSSVHVDIPASTLGRTPLSCRCRQRACERHRP